MQSDEIAEIMHGSDYDIVSLKSGIQIHNLFDTLIAASFLGREKLPESDQ